MVAELAVTDGLPPPADLPEGELLVTRLADGTFRIDHSDPRILISAEVLDAMVEDRWNGGVAFRPGTSGRTTYMGALLKIADVNRTVIYRITEWLPRIRAYIAEWPD